MTRRDMARRGMARDDMPRRDASCGRTSRRARLTAALSLIAAACVLLCSCSLVERLGSIFSGDGGSAQKAVAPLHPIAVKNVSAGKLLDFFADVAVGSEYGDGGDADVVCKWTKRVKYFIKGDATDEDRELISRLCERLNAIDGFPGIEEVSRETSATMTVSFVSRDEIMKSFEHADANCAGMAEYQWNDGTGVIRSARCAIDSALGADRRNTVCEEFLQSLGPARDSYMFSESVFYEGYTLMPFPSDADFAVMEMLYSPRIPAGTDRLTAISLAAQLLEWE